MIFVTRLVVERHARLRRVLTERSTFFYSAGIITLCLPDIDFVIRFFYPGFEHGGPTHSLGLGVLFGALFTMVCRIRYTNLPFVPSLVVGIGSAWVHLLMDVVTWGRGVMLCWPVSLTRYATGIPIFFGAHHSHPTAWKLHLITLTTELAYVFVLWRLLRRFWTARSDKFVQEASTR